MELKLAKREKVKLRIGLSSASGGGKTMSALLMAGGMCQDWSKIAVIDTENESSSLYVERAPIGKFSVLSLEAPYTPERYIEAIEICEKAGMEVIIIDSVSHEWEGKGGCLEIHSSMTGNSYTNWKSITPRHNKFIDKILHSKAHVITTARRKVDYVIEDNDKGKKVPIKAGLKEIQREGFEYELTVNFGLEVPSHYAKAEKDRTGLFMNKDPFIINGAIGETLMKWANSGDIKEEELYAETPKQKVEMAKICMELGVTDKEDLKAVSETLKGIPMSMLKQTIEDRVK
jgi:hypothetical protein